jgi:hypothetical protein
VLQRHYITGMPMFNVPDWALSRGGGASDAFQLVFHGGQRHGETAAKLAPLDYVLVTRGAQDASSSAAGNILFIDDASISQGHAAFVRHNKNGCMYCVALGSPHGTLINGSRCPERKPVKVTAESKIQFGCCPQQYAVTGTAALAPADKEKAKTADKEKAKTADKENVAQEKDAAKKLQQQEQQSQHTCRPHKPCQPLTSSFHTRFEREQLLALLPPPCHRDARAARALQLPKSIAAMLQVLFGRVHVSLVYALC